MRVLVTAVGLALLLGVALVAAIDSAFQSGTDQWRDYRLTAEAGRDFHDLERQLNDLLDSASYFQRHAEKTPQLLPTLQQVEEIAWEHGLDTRRIERVSTVNRAVSPNPSYTVTLVGTVFDAIPFVKELEDRFILRTKQASLQRADASGQTAFLSLSLEVASP